MAKLRQLFFLLISIIVFCTSVTSLGDLQTTMCESAHIACTCYRLDDLGFVTEAECCSALSKCCPITATCEQASGSCKEKTCSEYNTGCTCVRGTCSSGLFCCKGTCTTSAQDCSQAGGSCKSGTCSSYTDCNSLSGTCSSGFSCCTGTCTSSTQTCTQVGGSCKDNACSSYTDCTSSSGSCTSGNCCSGNCTAPTQTCAQAGGSCKDTACSAYTDCNSTAGACDLGSCCLGTCTAITTAGCSSDIECAQCGDICIQKTQWSESCASPTTEFDCRCITNTCTRTSKQAEKTVLPDCTITCVNSNGCICSSECNTAGEIAVGLDCGGKKTPEIQEVSLCDGCLIDRTCIRAGIQKQTAEGGSMFYCGMDKKLGWVKNIGEPCSQNHECFSYLCKNNICSDKPKEDKKDYKLAIIFGGIIFFIGLAFLIFKFFSGNKAAKEEEKKTEKTEQVTKPVYTSQESYKYKPELDVLEKKLRESLGKFKK